MGFRRYFTFHLESVKRHRNAFAELLPSGDFTMNVPRYIIGTTCTSIKLSEVYMPISTNKSFLLNVTNMSPKLHVKTNPSIQRGYLLQFKDGSGQMTAHSHHWEELQFNTQINTVHVQLYDLNTMEIFNPRGDWGMKWVFNH